MSFCLDDEAAEQSPFKTQGDINSSKGQSEADIGTEIRTSKSVITLFHLYRISSENIILRLYFVCCLIMFFLSFR